MFYIIVTQNVWSWTFPSNIVCWSLEKKKNHLTMHKCRARWQSDTRSVVCITKQASNTSIYPGEAAALLQEHNAIPKVCKCLDMRNLDKLVMNSMVIVWGGPFLCLVFSWTTTKVSWQGHFCHFFSKKLTMSEIVV